MTETIIPVFTTPTYERDKESWPNEAAEVVVIEQTSRIRGPHTDAVEIVGNGLFDARCPKCKLRRPVGELSLWPDPEANYTPRFLCSGCRSDINRREDTVYKDQMLQVLQACGVAVPDKLIQWTRVQCKIAEHPGGITYKREIDVEASLAADKLVSRLVEGGRTGARAGTGVVD